MFSRILQKFAEKSPVTVMVHGLLERMLSAEKIDAWFEQVREVQYTRKILFSSIVSIMLQVVCRVKDNVYSAYLDSGIDATRMAVYDKLKNIETKTSREIVRYIAEESELIIKEMKGEYPPLLPGFRTKFLDGNCIESTEHRLKALRKTRAGALPGKSLVVFDRELGIVPDVFPCEDGHAQERSLLSGVLETVEKNDLWVADSNFCVLSFMFCVHRRNACFVLRQHGNMPYKPLTEKKFIGESESGKVYEQNISLVFDNNRIDVRRIIVELNKVTRNGDKEVCVITNAPSNIADAVLISKIYRERWKIETAFQKLEKYLNSEINTLGYPKAALFGFCMALVAFNIYAVVMASLRAAYPDKNIDDEISDYYVAKEISSTYHGMTIILEEEESWTPFITSRLSEISAILLYLAGNINLRKFKKHKRGPKKPPLPKNEFKNKPHVSTARLLARK